MKTNSLIGGLIVAGLTAGVIGIAFYAGRNIGMKIGVKKDDSGIDEEEPVSNFGGKRRRRKYDEAKRKLQAFCHRKDWDHPNCVGVPDNVMGGNPVPAGRSPLKVVSTGSSLYGRGY